ncbi:uncharacterized protein LOC121430904 [Lytechinus variegatus]|uniref:uncharacterized protein LOC121430904 n=1 Tax=Lytechinus variegatus TaxID=7654 RepID=UPI001BB15C04|nr:uncharacterized protein LOC121430904 [Lytechinus variegatus]XP_041484269.1 uncharacterized protein LOC121430904 [Lytechinus variegatus]
MKWKTCSHFNRTGWIMAVTAFIHLTITYGIISSFVVLFVSLEEEFESSAVATGWMGSIAWGVASMFSPISTMLFLRWGHRPIACLGVLCCSIGLLVTSFLSNLWYMYASFGFVFAAGTNMINSVSFHLTALHFPGQKGVRPFAFVCLSGGAAMLAGAPLIGVCINALGWRFSYAMFSGITFIICLPMCYFYKKPHACHSSINEDVVKYGQCTSDFEGRATKEMEHKGMRYDLKTCSALTDSEKDGFISECEREVDSRLLKSRIQDKKLAERADVDKTSSGSGIKSDKHPMQEHHIDLTYESQSSCNRDAFVPSGKPPRPQQKAASGADIGVEEKDRSMTEISESVVNIVDDGGCLGRMCGFAKVPGLWMAAFGTMTTTAASVFNVINLVSYMQLIGLRERTSFLLVMGLGLAEMLARIFYFLVGSSLPVSGMTTMSAVNLAGAGLSACLALLPKMETIIAYVIVAGMARGIFYTINLPSCFELFTGLESAVVITFMMVGNGIGGLLSSTCGGLSFDLTGSYSAAFFTCAGLYFTSFLIFGSLRLWPRTLAPNNVPLQDSQHSI